jgi:hypothetical protein
MICNEHQWCHCESPPQAFEAIPLGLNKIVLVYQFLRGLLRLASLTLAMTLLRAMTDSRVRGNDKLTHYAIENLSTKCNLTTLEYSVILKKF